MEPQKMKKSEIMKELGSFVTCRPIISERSGEAVRNQYEVVFENGRVFQSYETLIAVRLKGKLYIDPYKYSVTTSKYLTSWCGYNPQERRAALADGRIGELEN